MAESLLLISDCTEELHIIIHQCLFGSFELLLMFDLEDVD